jgi:hypothetical protein
VVRDAAALVDRQLGRADVHSAVQLHRVGIDDLDGTAFGPEYVREIERQAGLAGSGGPDDDDEHYR